MRESNCKWVISAFPSTPFWSLPLHIQKKRWIEEKNMKNCFYDRQQWGEREKGKHIGHICMDDVACEQLENVKSSKSYENLKLLSAHDFPFAKIWWKCPCCNVWEKSVKFLLEILSFQHFQLLSQPSRHVKSSFPLTNAFNVSRQDVKNSLTFHSKRFYVFFCTQEFLPFAIAFVLDERMLTSM